MQKKALQSGLLAASAVAIATVASGMQVIVQLPGTAAVQPALPVATQAPTPPAPPPVYVSPDISSALARWNALRQSDNNSFSSYASFLTTHRGWPGETAMRKNAEKAISPETTSPGDVIAYFRIFPPLTNAGHARYACALLALGRVDDARAEARNAWTAGLLPKPDEDRLLGQFGGAFSPDDHDRRVLALLGSGDLQSAQRALSFASPARRPLFETRLALQTKASDAASRLTALGPVDGDAGLLQDRANWYRATGQSLAARQLLAQPHRLTAPPTNAETWYETLLTIARGAAADGQWSTVWQIASQLDDAYPAGTDVSVRPYAERDAYTSLAWMAGSAALNKLGQPRDAALMFERYARAARSPQTRSKGFYWAARAAAAAGQPAQSSAMLEQAAANPDQFYGQLSIERLGRQVAPPPAVPFAPTAAEKIAFESKSLVQATKALGQLGRYGDQSIFVRALADSLQTHQERLLAADWARSIGRPDLGVWIAREARNEGENFYNHAAFPEVTVPAAFANRWSIAHAIMRQESSFDRTSVSNAGARGMMQLMPGTARETAGKLGMGYDVSRLTSDPSYNIMLGTSYFGTLLDQWGGSVPLAVASYNAGAGNVRRWVRDNGDPRLGGADIVRWIEEIPFSETRNYVQRVLENAVVYDALAAERGRAPGLNRLSYYLGKSNPG